MAYGPVTKYVFDTVPISTGSLLLRGQVVNQIQPFGYATITFHVPALSPDSAFAHVQNIVWVTAPGNDPFDGLSAEALENLDSDTNPGGHVDTQSLAADDGDADQDVEVEIRFE